MSVEQYLPCRTSNLPLYSDHKQNARFSFWHSEVMSLNTLFLTLTDANLCHSDANHCHRARMVEKTPPLPLYSLSKP